MQKTSFLLCLVGSLALSGCGTLGSFATPAVEKKIDLQEKVSTSVASRVDRGIEVAQRALPTISDSTVQPAHYQHVYIDPESVDATSLKTITLRDAVNSNVLASTEKRVQKFDLDADKLNWIVLEKSMKRPSDLESVGGFGIESDNLSEVNFNLNEVEIINKDNLNQLIEKANKVSGVFYIVGYADESGIEASNYLLSQNRSISVADYLVGSGIHPSRINKYGAGISRVYSGLDRNRRASVSFLIEESNK